MRREHDEPLTIDADVIAAYLKRMQKPRMAAFVRHMERRDRDAWQREQDAQERYAWLYRRLCKYEPEQPRTEVNHQPPQEASD